MGIFSRKKQQSADAQVEASEAAETVEEPSRRGPKDISEVPETGGRLDLGSIRLRGVQNMQLRLEVDEDRQKVVGAHLVVGDSQMQIQAFAAPKTMGIWDEIRDEIAQGLATGGGTAEEVEGPMGTELHTRMPTRGAGGKTVFAPARFVGVDGPRWFFRAVMSGRAAIDETAAEQMYGLLDEMVIVRGDVPMAPREVLALELPKQAEAPAAEGAEGAESDGPQGEGAEVGGDSESAASDAKDTAGQSGADTAAAAAKARKDNSIDPFTRGPEITEIR